MSKMSSHELFGHMKHKLWPKEGLGPLKVRNRPNPGACKWSVTHHSKALDESYKFASEFIPIGGLNKEICHHEVAGV